MLTPKTILAAVLVVALHGCFLITEGDPPPPPLIVGEWFASHTEGDTELEFTISIDEPEPPTLVGVMLLQVTEPEEPQLEIRGDMTGTFHDPFVDMDFTLMVAPGYDPVEARFEGRYGQGSITGDFVLDPVGQADTLTLTLRRP